MLDTRLGMPLFFVLVANCTIADDARTTEDITSAVTSGTTYYLELPKMIGDTENCVAIADASPNNKAFAVEWDCNGSTSQQFLAESVGSGYYRLKDVNSGKCLNVYSGAIDTAHAKTGNQDGTLVQQYTCGTGDNNYWKFESYNGYQRIISKLHTGDRKYRCLDIRGGDSATANGTSVEIWTCGSSSSAKGNQTFNPVVVGSDDGGNDPCTAANLVWKTARKTNYTSYPDPGSEECTEYNGCEWAGQFAVCGTKSEAWVASHDIAALFPLGSMGKHDICIKSGTKTMVVTVVDTCADSDCDGCCTMNKGNNDALVDLESYTNVRWGLPDGVIQWADLGYNANACN